MNSIEKFVKDWTERGYEKGDTHTFWLQFLRDVLNVAEPEKFIKFEVPVKLKHTSFIDAFFPVSKVIIEQKSLEENLEQSKSQSDGSILTPYEQAQRYGSSLPYSMRPRWIIVSNFKEFLIYDMETLAAPFKILLNELPKKFHAFDFLVDSSKDKIRLELELSLKAGVIVGKLYDALRVQYINPDSDESLQSLNKLCVRLVFCLYAESAGIFGKHKIFRDYLQGSRNIRQDLILLFEVLNTSIENRDPYLANELKFFPYVNGGLFADNHIEIPNFNDDIKNLLLDEAGSFNWSGISPTIFGAVFESTLNPITRRAGGMHYTSIENIHKVIDPLFLDNLRDEFIQIISSPRNKNKRLLDFQDKIAALNFFDPACGSGNFLTESFICLRRLENDILRELLGSQITLGDIDNPVKVSISQFFGVEINDFACTVAKTALWIAEIQMLQETQEIIHRKLDFLPLKSYPNIFEGNALQIDWNTIAPNVNFIMGNPPFVGFTYQTPAQKADMQNVFPKVKNLDYVCAWYKKAADFIQGSNTECGFVSTNSIAQGETVSQMWKFLNVTINFAYRTFTWDSESNLKAHVHCVIIGFANFSRQKKFIFDGDNKIFAQNINAYLMDAPNILVFSRNKPLCNVPPMVYGNKPADGGNLILSETERAEILKKFPNAEKFIRPYIGAEEFINGKIRYCLWLVGANPSDIKKFPPIYERVKKVRDFRLQSKKAATLKDADRPTEFQEIRTSKTDFILVPRVSSENRQYIPMGFMPQNIIASDAVQMIPDATIFHFGILISSVHMAWTRAVCGRLESRYRYSKDIVYNNFVWCNPTPEQRAKIEITSQNILDVLSLYPDSTLADLYDDTLMPADLRAAHRENDKAVLAAYNFPADFTESEIVSALMNIYKNLCF